MDDAAGRLRKVPRRSSVCTSWCQEMVSGVFPVCELWLRFLLMSCVMLNLDGNWDSVTNTYKQPLKIFFYSYFFGVQYLFQKQSVHGVGGSLPTHPLH